MTTRVTLQTVADAVGVSRMTVSNAFSRPDQLSAELRARILSAADELGYVGPDPAARALARGSTGVVGIVFTSTIATAFADEVSTEFLGAITEGLVGSGLSLTLLSNEGAGGHIPARDVPMDATLVYSCDPHSPAIDWLTRRRIPLVHVDQIPVPDIPSINVEDRLGARQAAQHLIDLGHRHIGIVAVRRAGPHGVQQRFPRASESYVIGQRLLGWRDPLSAAGVRPVVVCQPQSLQDDGYRALDMLLGVDPGITGVLCFSDTVAHGVMLAAQDRGMTLPTDLSIVGFDDNPLAVRLRPALTTVRQDIAEKGRLAAAALVRAAAKSQGPADVARDAGSPTHVVLPTTLIIRESTARPR
jgi:DNA-binding LacI/PurR family transcriptional regulator